MKTRRKIIRIDEEKCTGCGICIDACAEGALALVNGKAKLVGEVYCDGLGACIGGCPFEALTIVEEECEDFDEEKAKEMLAQRPKKPSIEGQCQCPGSQAFEMPLKEAAKKGAPSEALRSELSHWPVKLRLINPQSPFLQGADLLLMADCVAASLPDLHRQLVAGNKIAIGCPKFDDLDEYLERLTGILEAARPKSLTVAHMEVPCCRGLSMVAHQALQKVKSSIPLTKIIISRDGRIIERSSAAPAVQ
ncbi:MAG: 4Fe-4S binding protein [Candidatus Eremiobacteraeota bacterium]|nr:4Fe-4S binding protein [Candidatus Eremiobacteraeota bacterium]